MEPFTIVIPALNESSGIERQIAAIRSALAGPEVPRYEIVVVDDGSSDDTGTRALAAGARVVRHPKSRGYGAGLKTGMRFARHETVVIIDADNTYPADRIVELVSRLDRADMVNGLRTQVGGGHNPLRLFAKWFLRKFAGYVAEMPIKDLNTGMRAFRKSLVQQYETILPDGFSFTSTITVALLCDGYRIEDVPIQYFVRTGRSHIKPKHLLLFSTLLLRLAFFFRPARIFLPGAVVCVVLATVKFALDFYLAIRRTGGLKLETFAVPIVATSTLLLALSAVQFLMIGMLADGLIRRTAFRNTIRSTAIEELEVQAER